MIVIMKWRWRNEQYEKLLIKFHAFDQPLQYHHRPHQQQTKVFLLKENQLNHVVAYNSITLFQDKT